MRTKRHHLLRNILIVILILLVAGFAIKYFVYDPAIEKAAETTYEKVLESATSDDSEASQKIQNAVNNMSDEDKETVSKIIEKHINTSTASELLQAYKDGDYEALTDFAKDNLSDEEMSQLYEIYQKTTDN